MTNTTSLPTDETPLDQTYEEEETPQIVPPETGLVPFTTDAFAERLRQHQMLATYEATAQEVGELQNTTFEMVGCRWLHQMDMDEDVVVKEWHELRFKVKDDKGAITLFKIGGKSAAKFVRDHLRPLGIENYGDFPDTASIHVHCAHPRLGSQTTDGKPKYWYVFTIV